MSIQELDFISEKSRLICVVYFNPKLGEIRKGEKVNTIWKSGNQEKKKIVYLVFRFIIV